MRNDFDRLLTWLLRVRKRHHAFAALLLTFGIGCFAVPAVWVQLAMIASETLQRCIDSCPTTISPTTADVAGLFCIFSSVAVFYVFEQKEPRIVQKDSFSISLP